MSTPNSAPQTPGELLTLRALAKAIGVDAGQLSRESSRPGFPLHKTDDGTLYDPAEVIAWRTAHVRRKKFLEASPPAPASMPAAAGTASPSPAVGSAKTKKQKLDRPAPPPPGAASAPRPPSSEPPIAAAIANSGDAADRPAPISPDAGDARATDAARPAAPPLSAGADDDLLAILRDSHSSALQISHAAVQLNARRVAADHQDGTLGPNALDALKKSLQEFRNAEADYIELEAKKGQLIPRDQVRMLVTECCLRLVRVCDSIENKIALEFSLWLADPAVAAMNADDRARQVRHFIGKITRAARTQEADEIEKLIDAAAEAQ